MLLLLGREAQVSIALPRAVKNTVQLSRYSLLASRHLLKNMGEVCL